MNPRSDLISAESKLWNYFKQRNYTYLLTVKLLCIIKHTHNDKRVIDLIFPPYNSVVFEYKLPFSAKDGSMVPYSTTTDANNALIVLLLLLLCVSFHLSSTEHHNCDPDHTGTHILLTTVST